MPQPRRRVSPIDLWGSCLWLDLEAHRKLVLLSLCENADTHGICYPGAEYIARRASVSRRNVLDHLAALTADGWIKTLRRGRGPGKTTVRQIDIDRVVREGRARQDAFSEERDDREKPPLLELLDEGADVGDQDPEAAGDSADSAPSQAGDSAESAPYMVIPRPPYMVIFTTRDGDLYSNGNQPVEPGSGNQPAQPASQGRDVLQGDVPAKPLDIGAGEKISPAAEELDPFVAFEDMLRIQLSEPELNLLRGGDIEVVNGLLKIHVSNKSYGQMTDRITTRIRRAALSAGFKSSLLVVDA